MSPKVLRDRPGKPAADPQLEAAIAAARAQGLTRFKIRKGRIEIEVDESPERRDADASKRFLKAVGAA